MGRPFRASGCLFSVSPGRCPGPAIGRAFGAFPEAALGECGPLHVWAGGIVGANEVAKDAEGVCELIWWRLCLRRTGVSARLAETVDVVNCAPCRSGQDCPHYVRRRGMCGNLDGCATEGGQPGRMSYYSSLNYIIAGWASAVDADLMGAAERRTGDCLRRASRGADHFAGALALALDFFNPGKVTFLFKVL